MYYHSFPYSEYLSLLERIKFERFGYFYNTFYGNIKRGVFFAQYLPSMISPVKTTVLRISYKEFFQVDSGLDITHHI